MESSEDCCCDNILFWIVSTVGLRFSLLIDMQYIGCFVITQTRETLFAGLDDRTGVLPENRMTALASGSRSEELDILLFTSVR